MTYYYNHKEGFKNASGTGLAFEGLASSQFTTIPIKIDEAVRDWGNPDSSLHLRAYLALGYNPTTYRYQLYDGTNQTATSVVVLANEVRDMNDVTGCCNGVAFWEATFKSGIVNEYAAVTWSSVQRIHIRDNA